jgi:hypothetical protein
MHVEVQVSGPADLSRLGAAFGEGIQVVLPDTRIKDAHLLWFKIQGRTTDPNLEAQTLCAAIESLPPDARQLWDTAAEREFEVDLESFQDREITSTAFTSQTLARIGALDARLVISVVADIDPYEDEDEDEDDDDDDDDDFDLESQD